MTDAELLERIRKLVVKSGYREYDLPDRGSVRNVGCMVMGVTSVVNAGSIVGKHTPWDRHFAVGEIMSFFDTSSGMISAAVLISFFESNKLTEDQYQALRDTVLASFGPGLTNIIALYDDIRNKRHGNTKPNLSAIMLVNDIYEMTYAIDQHDQLKLSFMNDPEQLRAIREYSGNSAIYTREVHPVVAELHKTLLNKLRILRDQEFHDVA